MENKELIDKLRKGIAEVFREMRYFSETKRLKNEPLNLLECLGNTEVNVLEEIDRLMGAKP